MALSNPRILYGIHSITPYNRTTGMPYGILKVIGSANLALNADLEQLFGGSSQYAWAAEFKTVNTELTAKVKAYPGFLFELFLGATVTDVTTPDTDGTVSTIANKNGTSIVASTGLASVSAIPSTGPANLKFGKYVVKYKTATTLDIFLLSDIDIQRGTDESYDDDTLLVGTTGTITTGGNTDVASLGLRFVGGAGTIAFVSGDTATFEVKPPFTSASDIVVGASGASRPNFGALMLAQKRATGEMFEIDAHNVVGGGLPISLEEMAFSQPELKMTCLYDSALDRVFTIRHVLPS